MLTQVAPLVGAAGNDRATAQMTVTANGAF